MEKTDEYYFHQTPVELCKMLIKEVDLVEGDRVLEPFRGEGAFYNCFPEFVEKDWCEIVEGRDYKAYDKEFDWAISNPPFHFKDSGKKVNSFYALTEYFAIKAKKGIAFLANDYCFSTLTPLRLKELNDKHNLYIHRIVVCNIKKWRGRYFFIIFKKGYSDFYKRIDGNF
jgi:hypothetical protein